MTQSGTAAPSGMGDFIVRGGAWVHRLANVLDGVEIGDGSRIDAYVTITGPVRIGRYTHIATGACLFGGMGIEVGDYSGISAGVKVFSSTDDFSGEWVGNPTVGKGQRKPHGKAIRIGNHCTLAANSVLLAASMEDGAVLGALSLAKRDLPGWAIYAGVPAKFIKARSKGVLGRV